MYRQLFHRSGEAGRLFQAASLQTPYVKLARTEDREDAQRTNQHPSSTAETCNRTATLGPNGNLIDGIAIVGTAAFVYVGLFTHQ